MPERPAAADLQAAAAAIADAMEREEGKMTARKRRIAEAAVLCFAERGFEATATSEIARRAGVAEATIFRHFGTKKELLVRLVRPLAVRVLLPVAVEEMRDLLRRSDGRLDLFTGAIMQSRIAFADRYGPLLRILMQELPFHPELQALLRGEAVLRAGTEILAIIDSFKASGQLPPDMPPGRALRFFVSLVGGYLFVRMALPQFAWDDDAERRATVDFILHGVGAGKGPRKEPRQP